MYKRQLFKYLYIIFILIFIDGGSLLLLKIIIINGPQIASCLSFIYIYILLIILFSFRGSGSVSYTHLDVYKRQGLEWLEKLIGKKGNRYVNTEKSISVPYWSCVNNHVTQMAAVRCGISPSTKLALI